ncbi:hypothetical protein O181_067564 [Austropuccinia psidii MF-1]|uniref:Tf2-1-like SH3-like domain-containing protein n=1 Tax=Austropuccinia psidii MF-1 TaxID=1389203 RepID=A0A9Q3EV72_9BASI|nr:hypothetical protein [Austropuccinia psidii MF-1]
MEWVAALPPGGDRSYNACLVLADRYSKTPMFLPLHEDKKDLDTAIMISNKVISHTGSFQNILSFPTAYHPQIDGLEERMIQTLEDMITRFCAYGIEFKASDGFTHDWCTLIPALELAYKTSIYSSTGKTLEMLEKGWNPRLPYDNLKMDLVDIHPTASSFKIVLDKARHHANRCMKDSFKYAKEGWDKSHKPPDFKVGDLVKVSTLNFDNIKGSKKLKYSFAGPFMKKTLHGPNALQLELTGELMNKHPAFPVSLIKPYSSSEKIYFYLKKEEKRDL